MSLKKRGGVGAILDNAAMGPLLGSPAATTEFAIGLSACCSSARTTEAHHSKDLAVFSFTCHVAIGTTPLFNTKYSSN